MGPRPRGRGMAFYSGKYKLMGHASMGPRPRGRGMVGAAAR